MFKDIFRLPGAFIPMFLSVYLTVILILLCCSVGNSCDEAKNVVEHDYDVTLTLTVKERLERIQNEDDIYVVTNTNTKLLNTETLNIVNSEKSINSFDYITNSYFFSMGIMCPQNIFDYIENAVSLGKSFPGVTQSYIADTRTINDIGVVGCTREKYASSALGVSDSDFDISYIDGCSFNDGIIVPKYLYELYDNPKSIVIGWYVTQTNGELTETEQDKYSVSGDFKQHLVELVNKPDAPKLPVKVAGYYTCSKTDNNLIVCSPEIWSLIYSAQDYYKYTGYTQNFYRNEINAIDEYGIAVIKADLCSPNDTIKVINELVSLGINTDDYLITANDFDYKFAISQITSIKSLANTIYVASLGFGVIITLVMVYYSVKKRQNEIYTLLTIGKSKLSITVNNTIEISLVLLSAAIMGLLSGFILGNSICNFINEYIQASAITSVSNLSRITDFMKHSDALKEQLTNAVNEYLATGFHISYGVQPHIYYLLLIFALGISIIALIFSTVTVSQNLMRRRQQ